MLEIRPVCSPAPPFTGVLILRTPPYRKTHLETFGEFLWIIKTHLRKLRAQREKIRGFWGIYKGKTLKKRVKKYGKNKNPPQTFGQILWKIKGDLKNWPNFSLRGGGFNINTPVVLNLDMNSHDLYRYVSRPFVHFFGRNNSCDRTLSVQYWRLVVEQ